MIYKLIVNAAFLAVGYYIGKEVGLSEVERKRAEPASSPSKGKTSRRASASNARTRPGDQTNTN